MSTIMGIVMVIKIIKYMVDTLIHAYTLHAIFGWSWRLLGMFYDVIAYFLMRDHHMNGNQQNGQNRGNLYPDLEAVRLELHTQQDQLLTVTAHSSDSTSTPTPTPSAQLSSFAFI